VRFWKDIAGDASFEFKAAVAFRRRGVQTKLVLPGRAEPYHHAKCDPALITREGITRRYIRRLVNLALLSPQLVEAILQGRQPTELTATRELGGPSNGGAPYPAVDVLHGCNGMFGHSAVIADRLSSWGYVTLAVDSLGPRVIGIANRCGRGLPDQAFDAYAALRYLLQLDFVDPARVAVFGQSMGGETALHAADHDPAAQFFTERFRAVIAYYPTATSRRQR
jgi:fermentation-respiration switch protein FrsA (DUF1100 family)